MNSYSKERGQKKGFQFNMLQKECDKTDKINRRNNYGEEKPKYQYIYQYILKIWGFRSTFRSTFPISVQEVHISTSGHPEKIPLSH